MIDDDSEVKCVIDSIIPDAKSRDLCLSVFLEALIEANKYGVNKWGAYYSHDKIRLLVGSLIVVTIEKRGLWVTLDQQLLDESAEELHLLEISNDWHWDTGIWSKYKPVPSRNGYYTPSKGHSQIWPIIRRLHFAFIKNTANKYAQLRKNSKHKNMPYLLAYLRHTLNQFVPEPIYETYKSRQYWLLVSHPEYYEDSDGNDLQILEPSGEVSNGWWTCHKNTMEGDLILLYRAKKRHDIVHIMQAKSDACSLDQDDYAREMGWTHGCKHMTLYKLKNPITLQDLREHDSFFKESWGAYRANFQGISFEIPSNVWEKLVLIAKQKNHSYPLESLLDHESTNKLNDLKSIVESDLDSLQVEESCQDYIEGRMKISHTIRYERDKKLRFDAIAIHGTKCKVCGFDFEAVYGRHGHGFIEVHHLIPVSNLGKNTKVNPRTDMTVVCSNCHRMIHRKKDHILSLSEIREYVKRHR